MLLYIFAMTTALASAGKSWSNSHDHGNLVDVSGPKSHLERLEVVCSKDHMTVHMHFDEPFYGVVFSHGSNRHERCVHVGPRAGITSASFNIQYDGCGTVEHLSGQFHENTIVIQFDEEILEAWDQAKRLRCEWLENFEKPSSKPTLSISDLDIVELNFQGDDIDCWMEVQEGKGPWARQVGGLVPIGSPLTLVIAINDHSREFDMRIKRCSASDGKGSEIELTDTNGCVLRPSLLTPFAKIRDFGGKATLVAYSHLYAFKFPDKMDVFVHCIVEVCRHGCPDSCSHQNKDYHSPDGSYDSLESKKIQKLKELASSKSVHEIHVSGHHKSPGSVDGYPIPGEIFVPAAQTQVHQIAENSSYNAAVSAGHKVAQNNVRPSFKPLTLAQKAKETKSQQKTAASNIHGVFVDIENNLQADHHSKFSSHSSHQESPASNVHRLVGHDIHYIADVAKEADGLQNKPHLPPLKDISYQAPQAEPAAWSADDVKPLTKQQVFQPHQSPRPQLGISAHHLSPPEVHKTYSHWSSGDAKSHTTFQSSLHKDVSPVPQAEPAAWSADDVKPLTKQEVFQPHQSPKPQLGISAHHQSPPEVPKTYSHSSYGDAKSHTTFHSSLHKGGSPVPQAEPAAWSADDVKPLTKQELFSHHKPAVAEFETNVPHHQPSPPEAPPVYTHWSGQAKTHTSVQSSFHKENPSVPKPEPNTWTFDEVNPMHSPEVIRLQLHTKKPEEPKPEPTSWTLEEVTGLSKEDLRALSLNHKMKSHSRVIAPPVYKELVHPFSTTTIPQPVYVSRYTLSPVSMSNSKMMKMMMMMPTMLPPTYQTAHWPQRTTARYLKPLRHHYPYPIPQFSPHQQMSMGVIADRRMDEEDGDGTSSEDLSLYHNLGSEEVPAASRIQIGQSASSETLAKSDISPDATPGDKLASEVAEEIATTRRMAIGETFEGRTTPESKYTEELQTDPVSEAFGEPVTFQTIDSPTTSQGAFSGDATKLEGSSGARPPVSGFVPPSLDEEIGVNPESKDRIVPGPRALDRKKRSSEPVFGVHQKFQAIAPSDLAYEWNLTSESAALLKGIREEIVYGICMSPAGMSAGVGFILIMTLLSIIASVILYEHSCRLSNKTSQLSFLTKNFNGQFEALYRFTRPYLYSDSRNVR